MKGYMNSYYQILAEIPITIPVSSWSDSYPYTATISNTNISENCNYKLYKALDGSESESDVTAYMKNTGYIFAASPLDEAVIFYAKKKPEIDLIIILKEDG